MPSSLSWNPPTSTSSRQYSREPNRYSSISVLIQLSQYLKRTEVKVAAVPQIEGLTVTDFLDYARKHQQLLNYLPDERDWVHIDKHWLCDVFYTLDSNGVESMIHTAEIIRKEHLEQSRNLLVDMKPEFADALQNCLNFSCKSRVITLTYILEHKGRSTALLKDSSKRKRKHQEMEEVKEEEEKLKINKQGYLKEFKRMREEMVVL